MTYRAKKLCRTLAVFLLSVLVLSLLVFVIARLAPGDPLVSYYGERAEKMKPAERAQAEARLGLDQPIAQQYLIWLRARCAASSASPTNTKWTCWQSFAQDFRSRCSWAASAFC